jgi:hypothetical protein
MSYFVGQPIQHFPEPGDRDRRLADEDQRSPLFIKMEIEPCPQQVALVLAGLDPADAKKIMFEMKFFLYQRRRSFFVIGFEIKRGYAIGNDVYPLFGNRKMPDDAIFGIIGNGGEEVGAAGGKIECSSLDEFIDTVEFSGEILEEQVMYGDDLQTIPDRRGDILIVCGVDLIPTHQSRQFFECSSDPGDRAIFYEPDPGRGREETGGLFGITRTDE